MTCSECGKQVDIVGDGLAAMHERDLTYQAWAKTYDGFEFAYERHAEQAEWCPGTGKPCIEEGAVR